MILLLVLYTAGLAIGIVFSLQIHKITKRSQRNTRERYAFWAVLFLSNLAIYSVVTFIPNIGICDLIINSAVRFGFKANTTEWITRGILILALLFANSRMWYTSTKKHDEWDGAISVRQYRLGSLSNINDSFIRRLFLLVIDTRIWSKRNEYQDQLKLYSDYFIYNEEDDEAEGIKPWYIEFATIYNILNSQVNILPERDWHSQENCFITPYNNKWLAVLICEDMPDKNVLNRFTSYIRKLEHGYFSIIIAIKNNPEGRPDKVAGVDNDVEFMFKNNALSKLVDFRGYFASIEDELNRPAAPGSDLSITDIYTPLQCKSNDDKHKLHSVSDYVYEWLDKKEQRQLAILGNFGQGKTVTALKITEHLIDSQSERIPILIRLRGKSPRNSNAVEILNYFAWQYKLNANALKVLNENGKLLIILDGFDEMDYVGDWEIRRHHFRSIWKLATENAKIILTGRGNYFMDVLEENSALGGDIPMNNTSHTDVVNLCMLTEEKIIHALRNADVDVKNRIAEILQKRISPNFIDLVSRPSQLALVVQIWKLRNIEAKYKNLTHACIIDEFLQGSYERQFQKATETKHSILTPLEREYFMMGIALRMYSLHTTEIDQDTFIETVKQLVDAFPDRISKSNHSILKVRNGKTLGQYYYDDPKTREAIRSDIRTCGVLTRDTARDRIVFAHKPFMDLMVAKCFYWKIMPKNDNCNMMSRAVQNVTKVRALRYSDTGNRRLLAELIMHHVVNEQKKSEKKISVNAMFQHCYKFVVFSFSKNSDPQKTFKKYCKTSAQNGNSNLYDDTQNQLNHIKKSERLRLLLVPLVLLPATIVLFLIKAFNLITNYTGEALSNIESTGVVVENELSLPPSMKWVIIGLLLGIVIIYSVFYLSMRFYQTKFLKNAGTALYAWYCGCLYEGFTDEAILKDFSIHDAETFRKFLSLRET